MLTETSRVVVACVVRPLLTAEKNGGAESVVRTTAAKDGSLPSVQLRVGQTGTPNDEETFSFDFTCENYDASKLEADVYNETVARLIDQMQHGNNVTVLMLGSAQSGKTTLLTGSDKTGAGIGAKILAEVWTLAEALRSTGKNVFVTISAAEFVPVAVLNEDGAEELDAVDASAGDSAALTRLRDLLNPHGRPMRVKPRLQKSDVVVDGLAEVVVQKAEDLQSLFVQSTRTRRLGVNGAASHHPGSHAVYTVKVHQRDAGRKMGLVSKLQLVDTSTLHAQVKKNSHGLATLQSVISGLGNPLQKGRALPVRQSFFTHVLQDAFGGNALTVVMVTASPSDKAAEDTKAALKTAAFSSNVVNSPQINFDDTEQNIEDLRTEILSLKDRLSDGPPTAVDKEEVVQMEKLVEELRLAKKDTLREKTKLSEQTLKERVHHLAAKGMLEFVMRSGRKGVASEKLEAKLSLVRAQRDKMTSQFREQRKRVDGLKEVLEAKVNAYAAVAASGKKDEATKNLVKEIQDLKSRLEKESETLRNIKEDRKKTQEDERKIREESRFHSNVMLEKVPEILLQSEEEERRQLLEENLEMMEQKKQEQNTERELKKSELQLNTETKTTTPEEFLQLQSEAQDLKHELSLARLEAACYKEERDLYNTHLQTGLQRHQRQLEDLKQHHTQNFREYRQACENQKMSIDSRYRHLLEDAIQDAVYQSARNSELKQENIDLKAEVELLKKEKR